MNTDILGAVASVRENGFGADNATDQIVYAAARQHYFDVRSVGGSRNQKVADSLAVALLECEHRSTGAARDAANTVLDAATAQANGAGRRLDQLDETNRAHVSHARTTIHRALSWVEVHGWGTDLIHDTSLTWAARKYLAVLEDNLRDRVGETFIDELGEALHVGTEWPDEITNGQVHLIWSSALAYEIRLKGIEHALIEAGAPADTDELADAIVFVTREGFSIAERHDEAVLTAAQFRADALKLDGYGTDFDRVQAAIDAWDSDDVNAFTVEHAHIILDAAREHLTQTQTTNV